MVRFATPEIKRRTRRNQDDPARSKSIQKTPQRPRKVMDIANYFQEDQTGSKKPYTGKRADNNSTMCRQQRPDKLPVLPSASTPTCPQMSVHAHDSAQSIGSRKMDHVTQDEMFDQIGTKNIQRYQNPGQRAHLLEKPC